ncbi:MAG: serine protein kinase PrkA [Candidatus Spechtbacteria bacterium]|nr:serine protein kinase PrkA [Candidatus Spechtbacteria bacterium]
MEIQENERLGFHLGKVLSGERRFENAAQGVSRMILEKGLEKTTIAGRTSYEFKFFREGKRHIIGWHQEINDFVNFVKDASEGGSSKEMAFVLVGEPGNGKTFFVEFICGKFRWFIAIPANKKYTFNFIGLEELAKYGNIRVIQSQTFEDPVTLAMNLFESQDETREYLAKAGFDDATIERLYVNHNPLGACSEYIWNDIRNYCDGDIAKMLGHIQIVPVPIAESLGTVTGKYSARDKITSSADDLLGKRDISRVLQLADSSNPFVYNVRKGAIARVAGGGIHFSDELFKNKKDLVQIYLQVIQNRTIELDGYKWPIDSLIIATSNNWEYNRFTAEKEEAPIKDRCRICYVSHNTHYRLQQELSRYAIGSEKKVAVTGDVLHEDPNLIYAVSVAVTLTRLPHSEKLTPVEMMKLEAGETAGEQHVKTLAEIKEHLNANPNVTMRWGQKGVGHRGLGRIIQVMLAMPETHEGKCLFALDCFKAAEREVLDYITESVDRDKFMEDLRVARRLYRREVRTSIFNAFRDDPDAIRKDVMAYVNMIIGIGDERVGPDKIWRYIDPQTKEMKPIKIDERFITSVESRLGLNSAETRETHRTTIRKIYGQRITTNPNYDFMDNENLVKAVTDVRLESDVAGATSLMGALSNKANEENMKIHSRMVETMFSKLGYCRTCAEKTIEYFIEKVDES